MTVPRWVEDFTEKEKQMVRINQEAPDFTLQAHDGTSQTLSKLRGQWVVLFFYPLDFTFVCPTEVTCFRDAMAEFDKAQATVLGCSVDSIYSHKAWVESFGGLNYPLLSDMKREVGAAYGVLLEDEGHHHRATFIIDPEGKVRWMQLHDNSVGRSVHEILRSLKALQTGKLTACEWQPGETTLS
jgi:peroxiredoxin 2/4